MLFRDEARIGGPVPITAEAIWNKNYVVCRTARLLTSDRSILSYTGVQRQI